MIPVFPVSRVNPGGRARSRVLDRPAAFHEDPHRFRLGIEAAMRNLLKTAVIRPCCGTLTTWPGIRSKTLIAIYIGQ